METTLEEPGGYPLTDGRPRRGRNETLVLGRIAQRIPWPIAVVTVLAGALRFIQIDGVSPNLFYDAAVRTMSGSLHSFFFGSFDPSGLLSIDKPPLDLWLQVISVKLLGWNQLALRLPEALAGTLAIPLLYDAVRRAVGRPAALGAATALAVLPESVLTSRSDTMDSLMMLLVLGALWLLVRAAQTGGRRDVVLAGVVMGLAFNVKLLESLIAVPGLATLYALAASAPLRRRLTDLALGGLALVGVGLAWAVPASLAGGPWPVGSTDGSVWNAMFVFNGFGKVASAATAARPGGPGVFRLVVSTGWHYDALFGCILVAGAAIGLAAALAGLRGRRAARHGRMRLDLARSLAIAVAVWIAFSVVVFDTMQTVHARYLEAMAPALAITIGYGATWLAGLGGRSQPAILATFAALALICAYTLRFDPPELAWGVAALILAAAGALLIVRAGGSAAAPARWLLAGLIVACALVFPVHETFSLVRAKANDSLGLATMPTASADVLSNYLRTRTAGVRYELAADEPLALAPLIIRDQRALLPLTSFAGIRVTSLPKLQAAVRAGQVRYGLVARYRCSEANRDWAACTPAARWIRQNGIDVTPPGLAGASHLYLLPASRA